MADEETKILAHIGIIFLIALFIGALFEIGILAYSYFNADKVECNWLWCTFTSTRSEISQNTIISSNSECYINGVKVNCSNMDIVDVEKIINKAMGK